MMNIATFLVLLGVTLIVKNRFMNTGPATIGAGSFIMSIGIFIDFALTELWFYTPELGRILVYETVVIWGILAWSFYDSYRKGRFQSKSLSLSNRFAIGTWVAGTAVITSMIHRLDPSLSRVGLVLTIIAIMLYMPFLVTFLKGHARLWRRLLNQKANGVILLSVVATQSIALSLRSAFDSPNITAITTGLIYFGCLVYISGFIILVFRLRKMRYKSLARSWSNTNCILHGAVSITGLAMVLTSDINTSYIVATWFIALTLLIIVELVELARAYDRVSTLGVTEGLLRYDVTQWARNFTFGMFFAFSYELLNLLNRRGLHDTMQGNLSNVVNVGKYIAFGFILAEIAIFIFSQISDSQSVKIRKSTT